MDARPSWARPFAPARNGLGPGGLALPGPRGHHHRLAGPPGLLGADDDRRGELVVPAALPRAAVEQR